MFVDANLVGRMLTNMLQDVAKTCCNGLSKALLTCMVVELYKYVSLIASLDVSST